MPTRAHVCAWIALWGLAVSSPATAQDRTERDVVDLIVRDGPRARAIRAEVEVVRREQFARLVYPNPGVLFSREGAGFSEFLQVEQALPVFGTRAALARAGVAATAAAEAQRDARLWALRADATALVARVMAEQERLQAAEALIREVERLIEVLRAREREGEGSRFDRLRAEQELRETRHSSVSAAVALADARAAVSALLPRDSALSRIGGRLHEERSVPALEILITRASSTRAELRALQLSAERTMLESDAARRARLPAPVVFGGLKRADNDQRRDRGGVVGVNVSLPLFDSGGREAARWTAERSRLEAERAAIEHEIRAEIVRAAETLALRHAAISRDQLTPGEELTRIAEVAYREGERGILELLDAVRTSSRASMLGIEMRLDLRLAQIALERAVGDILWP